MQIELDVQKPLGQDNSDLELDMILDILTFISYQLLIYLLDKKFKYS